MQTIKITTNIHDTGAVFVIDDKVIATIGQESANTDRYSARYGAHAYGRNMPLAYAVEFISDRIAAEFATLGVNVEFVNA